MTNTTTTTEAAANSIIRGAKIRTTYGTTGTVEGVNNMPPGDYTQSGPTYWVRSDAGGCWVAGVLHAVPAESIAATV